MQYVMTTNASALLTETSPPEGQNEYPTTTLMDLLAEECASDSPQQDFHQERL